MGRGGYVPPAVSDPKARVHFHSLGCPKNQLDTEVMLGSLALEGYAIAERLEDADAVVVNTCAFIESAREESVQAILDVADLRAEGRLRALVVTGCLPQRYGDELARELPEVDAFVGTGRFPEIAGILQEALAGRSRGVYVEAGRTHLYDERDPRLLVGPGHTAYVKIAEGCNRPCAFCAIPGIRGRFQSRTLDSILREIGQLAESGVREVNLVAQDSTAWGWDLPGRPTLTELVRALDAAETAPDWIRLLYLYPSAVTDALVEALAEARRILPYVDVPLQHASDPVLRAMKRGVTAAQQQALVERLRKAIPDLTLRTTVIVGFPGETADDFDTLCEFVRRNRFDRLGAFRYSDEEGTTALALPNKVPRELARSRHRRLMSIQREIMGEALRQQVGREETVLVDRVGAGFAVGRTGGQAPEIDGCVFLTAEGTPPQVGERVRARVTGVRGLDLEARIPA